MADPAPVHVDVLTWLEQLYGTADDGWLSLFSYDRTNSNKHTDWAHVNDLASVVASAAVREPRSCIWLGAATRATKLPNGARGGIDDCTAIPGLWLDVDVEGPGHLAEHRLAKDRAHAHRLVDAFPLKPTAVIESGGGLQAWWLFAEMAELDARTLEQITAWGATWARLGIEHDIDVDNVFEAARVMRLPGTTNRKAGLARPVEVIAADWSRRYGLDDIDQHLDAIPEQPQTARTGVPYIGPERPGDAFSARHTGSEMLQRAGFTFMKRDRSGDEKWCRPGKDPRDGHSAVVYADDGHTTIYSDTVTIPIPEMEKDTPYKPFQLYAFFEHQGNFSAAASTLSTLGYGTPASSDLGDLLGDSLKGGAPAHPNLKAPPLTEWGEAHPLPDAEPIPTPPIHAFPTWIADQIGNVTNQLLCDPMLPAVFALGALSVASLGHIQVNVRAGETMRSTGLYLAASGPPASGKSPALDFMFEPIRAHETAAIAAAHDEVNKAKAQRSIADKRAKEAIDNAARIPDDKDRKLDAERLAIEASMIEDPPNGELITSDITPEKIASIMVENSERIAVVSDESGVLDIDRYGDKASGKKMDIYLQGFTGQTVAIHRQTAPTIRLRHPLLGIVAGVQPEALSRAMGDHEFRTRGLGARFLTASTPTLATNTDIDRDVWDSTIGDTYDRTLAELARRWASWAMPATLDMAPEARQRFSAWAADLRLREMPGGPLEGEGGWVSKMRTSVLRIAGLFHLADGSEHSELVPVAVMNRAIEVGEFFVSHHTRDADNRTDDARRLLAALIRLTPTPTTERSETGETGQVSRATAPIVARRDLGRGGPRGLRKIDDYLPALELLIECGLVRLAGATGGPNQHVSDLVKRCAGFEVHPDAANARQRATRATDGGPSETGTYEDGRTAEGVAPVARVAYRGSKTPSLSVRMSDSDQTPCDMRDSATDPTSHVIPSTPIEADPASPDDDDGSLW